MKIWCQSVGALGTSLFKAYDKALRKHVQKIARPGNTIELHGVKVMSPALSWLSYAEYLNTAEVMENAIKAEKQGYDAFVVLCMDDPGFRALRQLVSIPVVNAGEAAFHTACLLAPKFALLGHSAVPLQMQTENVIHYGLGDRLVPSGFFGTSVAELAAGFNTPAPIVKGAREVAKKASMNGACMLVPCCGILNMILVSNKITEIEGIPVLDAIGAAVKLAEHEINLSAINIKRSSLGPYTQVSKKELSDIRKLYGVQ